MTQAQFVLMMTMLFIIAGCVVPVNWVSSGFLLAAPVVFGLSVWLRANNL